MLAITYHHVGNKQSIMDVPLPSKVVFMAECLLQAHNLEDELVSKETCQEDHSSIDGKSLQRWKNNLHRFVEQGLIHRSCALAEKLVG